MIVHAGITPALGGRSAGCRCWEGTWASSTRCAERALLIRPGRTVREQPAAGMDDPTLEHEFIG